jgi:tripartite-type tricarboxylate transporter receptor subunit TctC
MYAPAGTPPAIVAKLNADVNRLLKSADVASTLASQGLTPTGGSAEQLGELTRKDLERWAKVVHDAKITAD